MTALGTQRKGLFAPIDTREAALKTIRQSAIVFLVVAGLQAGLAILIAPSLMLEAALYAILGVCLLKWRSRVVATVLLLLSAVALVVTVLNKIGLMSSAGHSLILAIIVAYMALRAVVATFTLHGRFA